MLGQRRRRLPNIKTVGSTSRVAVMNTVSLIVKSIFERRIVKFGLVQCLYVHIVMHIIITQPYVFIYIII